MIMAIADMFGIEAKIYEGEQDDYDPREDMDISEMQEQDIKSLKDVLTLKRAQPSARDSIENSEVAQKLADIDVESLMAKSKEKQVPESLLGQGN